MSESSLTSETDRRGQRTTLRSPAVDSRLYLLVITDLHGHPRSMTFVLLKSQYATFY